MEAKVHKDVVLFKRILTHDKFGDHVEEVHFPNIICLTGVKIGAAPGTGSLTDVPHVHVFAHDLHTLSGSRYACVAEHCNLPDSGTRAVRVEPIFTKQLLLRGQYQTLPLAVYGWALPAGSAIKDTAELTDAATSQLAAVIATDSASASSPASILPPPLPFTPPFLSLPPPATQALQSMLPRWASVRTFEQAMRFQPLDKAQLQAILTAAENVCQAATRKSPVVRGEQHTVTDASAPDADIKEEPEVDLVGNSTLAGMADGMFMDLDERLDSLPATNPTAESGQEAETVNEAAIGECAAYMAAEWCGVLGGAYASSAAADFGLAGLAAAVVVASCPRHASHFIAAQGMLALASVLTLLRPPKAVVRYAITAAELLTRSAGAFACEAALGWVEAPELSDEVVQAAQATAASLGAKHAQRRAAAGTALGVRPERGLSTEASRGRLSQQQQDGDVKTEPTESNAQDRIASDHDHEGHNKASEQLPETSQVHGSDQEEQPLVEYDDDEQNQDVAQYDDSYEATGREHPEDYDMEDQDQDEHYNGANEDQQHYLENDEHAQADFPMEQQQHKEGSQPEEADRQQLKADAGDNAEGKDEAKAQGGGQDGGSHQSPERHQPTEDADEWDMPETGSKVDEMMAETPEHLSQLGDEDGQGPEAASKQSSPLKAAESDAEHATSSGKKIDRQGPEDEGPSEKTEVADEGKDQHAKSSDRHRRSDDGRESRRSRSDKEKRHRHSRDGHRSRERSKDRDADREKRHKERKSRSKRSRSREPESDKAKRSRHSRPHHSRDRASPEAAPARPHPGEEERPSRATTPLPTPASSKPKGLIVVKAKQFDGCYSQLVDKLLDTQPRQVVAIGSALLKRLRLYAVTARTTEVAEQLVKGHMSGAAQLLTSAQVSKLINTLSTHLGDLSEELLKSDDPTTDIMPSAAAQKQEGHLPEVVTPDPCTVTTFASRQLLELLAAVLHVPSLHAAHLTATGTLLPQTKGPQVEAAFLQPLLSGCKALLAALLSTPSGVAYLVQQHEASQSLITALQTRSTGSKSSAFALAETLGAITALQQICQDPATAAVSGPGSYQAKAPTQEILQALCEQSITVAGRKAVAVAISAVPGALHRLMVLMHVEVKKEGAKPVKSQPIFSLTSMCAAQLLLEFVSDEHPSMLSCWAAHASDLDKLTADALTATGMARVRHTLQALQARAQAAMALADEGPASLVQTLTGLLPPLANSGVKGVFVVEAEAAVQFMHDISKSNTAEAGLHLLAAVLSHEHASRDAVAATEANALQALERALRTGTVLLTAAQADALWSVGCGDAIEDAKQAINRWQVLKFVLAASTATRALFARLQQRSIILKSITLLDCLLEAHAAIVTTSESLGASLGSAAGPETQQVLQARQALTGALKIWWDQSQKNKHNNEPDWQPALLPSVFAGAKAAAMTRNVDPNQAPGKMYTRICVISDILPSEWPPVQVRKGVPHPPPTHREYRVALANGLIPLKQDFRDMVTTAVASDSRMFRAALVRLVARASGLGGGMGVFLAEPITKALNEALTARAALSELRRVLEIIVPLAYRPPIKAAFLDLKLADILGQLLGRLVPVLGQGADAGSLCTMVLEAILTLQDPETCLNPMGPAFQRVPDEIPTPAEGGLIAAIIMASLSRLGGNAHVAKRVLRLLSTHLPGRVVLRLGAAKWQAQATGGEFATAVGSKASLQWAASRLWAAAEAVGGDPKLRSTNQEVAQLLEQVAALGEDTGEADLTLPSGPAPNRFAAAVLASVEAAGNVKAAETSDFLDTAHPMTQLFDPASHTFWRNVKERAVAPVTAFGRNPARWDVWEPAAVPPVPTWLSAPLTPAKRSRDRRLDGASQGGSTLASPSQRLKTETAAATSQSGAAAAAKAAAGPMPGDDLPPVLAPPGRSRAQQLRGRTGGNSSRPASLHVDDFEKAASMAAPAAISITPKTSGITLPPTLAATTARSGSITPRDSGTPRSNSFTSKASAGPASTALPTPHTPSAPGASLPMSPPPPPQPPKPQPGVKAELSVKPEPTSLRRHSGSGSEQPAAAARQTPGAAAISSSGSGRANAQPAATLSAAQQPHIAALMQALTVGGDELQNFLQAHPDMRAAIPVLLDGLRNLKTSAPAKQ
ncbi:hypothetical protein WJX82_000994 [Trebouxia sp. C0006]